MGISCRPVAYLLLISAVVLLTSPASAQTCRSDGLASNFENCQDLQSLRATLHWTYRYPTLSIAFTAQPAAPGGWVAWGLNPTAARMVGTQALLAFTASNGSLVVNTYNLSSTSPDLSTQSAIDYGVLNRSAIISRGRITLFANLSLPAPIGTTNHAWQVGPVSDGAPLPHALNPENFASVGQLNLGSTSGTPSSPSPTPTPTPTPRIPPPSPSGTKEILASWVWVCGVSLAVYVFGF